MWNRIWVIVGAAALAGTALAAGPEQAGPKGPSARPELSSEQKTKIEGLSSAFRKAEIRRQADLRIARVELQELISAPTIDDKAVLAKARQVSDLQAVAFQARVEHRLAVNKVLTPEQRAQRKEFRARKHLRERRGAPMNWRHSRQPRWSPPSGQSENTESPEGAGPAIAELEEDPL